MSGADTKQESRREIAEQIVNQIPVGAWTFCDPQRIRELIERALDERDKRAATIAESHTCSNSDKGCGVSIAAAIRNEDTNA